MEWSVRAHARAPNISQIAVINHGMIKQTNSAGARSFEAYTGKVYRLTKKCQRLSK